MLDHVTLQMMEMRLYYSAQRYIPCMPTAKEILADIDDLMDDIGISKEEQEGMKLWSELESYTKETG